MILYYVHDPMCSWCWGFRPTWAKLKQQLSETLEVRYLLGGLAPDSSEPMPEAMQLDIAGYWRRIQAHIPGTEFNFDFWTQCQPRRSTYPACRAVIAARLQQPERELAMIEQIQRAYYLNAQNPSDDDTLIALATNLGLDAEQFAHDLNAKATQAQLIAEMKQGAQLGARGFPSLILQVDDQAHFIALDYNNPATMLTQLQTWY